MRTDLELCNIALISAISIAKKITELCFALVGLGEYGRIMLRTNKSVNISRSETVFKLYLLGIVTELNIGNKSGVIRYCVGDPDDKKIFTDRYNLAADESHGLLLHAVICIDIPVIVNERKILICFNYMEASLGKLPALVDKRRYLTFCKSSFKMWRYDLVIQNSEWYFSVTLDFFAVSDTVKFIGCHNPLSVKRIIRLT